jgi:hypothetical protein
VSISGRLWGLLDLVGGGLMARHDSGGAVLFALSDARPVVGWVVIFM